MERSNEDIVPGWGSVGAVAETDKNNSPEKGDTHSLHHYALKKINTRDIRTYGFDDRPEWSTKSIVYMYQKC